MRLHELKDVYDKAVRLAREAEAEKDRFLAEQRKLRVEPLAKQLESEKLAISGEAMVTFGSKIAEADRIAREARAAYEAALVAEVAADTNWLPVGTVVEEWEPGRYGRGEWHRTGRKGKVAVWTRDSASPDNMHSYSVPNPGDVYIRLLNKGGSESKKFVRPYYNFKDRWRTEGAAAPRTV